MFNCLTFCRLQMCHRMGCPPLKSSSQTRGPGPHVPLGQLVLGRCVDIRTSCPPPPTMSERLQGSYTILCGYSVHQNYCKLSYMSLPKTFWTTADEYELLFTTATTPTYFLGPMFENYTTWIHWHCYLHYIQCVPGMSGIVFYSQTLPARVWLHVLCLHEHSGCHSLFLTCTVSSVHDVC